VAATISTRSAVRVALLLLAVALGVGAAVRYGGDLRDSVADLHPAVLAGAFLAVLAGLAGNMLSWRALLAGLGSPLPLPASLRVFFLGQLGKYLPGSVWPLLAQMELAREHGVPRSRGGTVGLVTVAISLLAALVLAAVTLPLTSADAVSSYGWAFLAVPVVAVLLLPPVVNRLLARMLRLARRPALERPLPGRAVAVSLAWATLSWLCYGVHIALLAGNLGAQDNALLPLAVGGFALAWTVGFLVVLAPAGAGVREGVLVLVLAPVLDAPRALLVALASRLLMSLGDLTWAGGATVLARRHGLTARPDPARPDPAEIDAAGQPRS